MQILPGRDLDEHHLPGQHDPAGGPLPLPQERGGLPGEAARIPDRDRTRLPVQLCLLTTNRKFFLPLTVSFYFYQ